MACYPGFIGFYGMERWRYLEIWRGIQCILHIMAWNPHNLGSYGMRSRLWWKTWHNMQDTMDSMASTNSSTNNQSTNTRSNQIPSRSPSNLPSSPPLPPHPPSPASPYSTNSSSIITIITWIPWHIIQAILDSMKWKRDEIWSYIIESNKSWIIWPGNQVILDPMA